MNSPLNPLCFFAPQPPFGGRPLLLCRSGYANTKEADRGHYSHNRNYVGMAKKYPLSPGRRGQGGRGF